MYLLRPHSHNLGQRSASHSSTRRSPAGRDHTTSLSYLVLKFGVVGKGREGKGKATSFCNRDRACARDVGSCSSVTKRTGERKERWVAWKECTDEDIVVQGIPRSL